MKIPVCSFIRKRYGYRLAFSIMPAGDPVRDVLATAEIHNLLAAQLLTLVAKMPVFVKRKVAARFGFPARFAGLRCYRRIFLAHITARCLWNSLSHVKILGDGAGVVKVRCVNNSR